MTKGEAESLSRKPLNHYGIPNPSSRDLWLFMWVSIHLGGKGILIHFKNCWTDILSCLWDLEPRNIMMVPLLKWGIWELNNKWSPKLSPTHSSTLSPLTWPPILSGHFSGPWMYNWNGLGRWHYPHTVSFDLKDKDLGEVLERSSGNLRS